MTIIQLQAQWELCRQGLPLVADEALQRWDLGQPYQLDVNLHLARSIKALIEQCNWEIQRTSQTA